MSLRPSRDQFLVRFVISSNLPGSVVRITADTASVFTGWGIPTTVAYPAVDWWDYKIFELSRARGLLRAKQWVRLAGEMALQLPLRKPWCGFKYHQADPRVQTVRYGLSPSASRWRAGEIAVVHPPYLVPHLLRTLPSPNVKMVCGLHMNLEQAVQSSSELAAAWYKHWVARERLVSVPRFTSSVQAKEAAERLGIRVRRVIPDGIDLSLFQPPKQRDEKSPVVTLYCTRHAQKGQQDGLDALKQLKAAMPKLRLRALGELFPGNESLFERRYGYLHGESYAQAVRESDILIYPSRYDGFPAPPLQAMASGCALVTTAGAGVTDYAVSGENALVVEPGDVAGLRDSIKRLLEDAELRRRLQTAAVQTARRYDVQATSRQLLDFLREIYEENSNGGGS